MQSMQISSIQIFTAIRYAYIQSSHACKHADNQSNHAGMHAHSKQQYMQTFQVKHADMRNGQAEDVESCYSSYSC
jgi:hypothetical protein